MVFEALFWLLCALIFYSYVLYPLILQTIGTGKKLLFDEYDKIDNLPTVAIVISVLNEELVIKDKIQSVLNGSYPENKLTLWIGSDGSTDRTNNIISTLAATNPNIRFHAYTQRRGKTAVINSLVDMISHTKPDILVFTDANVFFEEHLVFEIIKYFKDTRIGQVAANVLNTLPVNTGIAIQEKHYIQRENNIKYNEGLLWGTMQGAFGACYAIRANLYTPFPSVFVADDFYLSMHVLKQGFKAILNLKAICYEDVSTKVRNEFKRKARISAGSFTNLAIYRGMLLNPFTAVGFTFISHKLIRWLAPVMLIVMPLCCLAVWNKFYIILFVLQICLMLTPLMDDLLFKLTKAHFKGLRLVGYFYYMNLALLTGFFQYAQGVSTKGWTPTPRNV